MASYVKDPDATLDYGFDWSEWLATGETISASTWTVASGLTTSSNSRDATTTSIWISGGTVGNEYVITNHITTSAGRIDDRSHTIRVKNR